jgi:hypothetical protein
MSYREADERQESAPGRTVIVARADLGALGLDPCYDRVLKRECGSADGGSRKTSNTSSRSASSPTNPAP